MSDLLGIPIEYQCKKCQAFMEATLYQPLPRGTKLYCACGGELREARGDDEADGPEVRAVKDGVVQDAPRTGEEWINTLYPPGNYGISDTSTRLRDELIRLVDKVIAAERKAPNPTTVSEP